MTARTTNILMYKGKPIVVSDDADRLYNQAILEAKLGADKDYPSVTWNESRNRLFRVHHLNGRPWRFTGYEMRKVVQA